MTSKNYEVFLSFRGKDTRQGFTDVLYEYMTSINLRVFKDDNELTYGDEINTIFPAIESSKVCIVIFSKHFAESRWCLREVTRMVELEKIIVPVFYDVSPDDLKLKEGSVYADDFTKLQFDAHVDPVEIDNWKNALRKAASIKGGELKKEGYTPFCKELINKVISKLGPRKSLDLEHQFVGSTNKAAAIRLLDMASSSQEIVYLGIHGMGGIGKTTLTKLIFNQFASSFEYTAFLPDIQDFSASNNGDHNLPTHLYENLHPKPVGSSSRPEEIHNLFRKKKVFLILDDVYTYEQIKKIVGEPSWFGSGSRIIFTSRDKKVFTDFELASKCQIQHLEMEELERRWSLELFSRCAFGESSPPSSYKVLSEKVLDCAGGLPLALTVIAKSLRSQNKMAWRAIITKLEKTPQEDVKARLKISYDSLEDEHKMIFLDIACLINPTSNSKKSHIFYVESLRVVSTLVS